MSDEAKGRPWTFETVFDDDDKIVQKVVFLDEPQRNEKAKIDKITNAARAFVKCQDEFEDYPGCCGEYLDALIVALDEYGD